MQVRVGDFELGEIADQMVVQPGVAPAACLALGLWRGGAWHWFSGAAGSVGAASAGVDTIFDLASVTKPLVAVAFARVAQRGRISYSNPLEKWLPETRGTPTGPLPLELLLAHRAGLEGHLPLFSPLLEARPFERTSAIQKAAAACRAECRGPPPEQGFAPLYSDLGYLLLGEALCRSTGRALDELIEEEVCAPLGLEISSVRCSQIRLGDFNTRVAPSETVAWRGGELRGVVHDENAWAFAGYGAAGHAGLFGTAVSVARFGAAMLDTLSERNPQLLDVASARRLTEPRAGGSLRAGFDGVALHASSAGRGANPAAFGHLGFTGTSLWCDPERSVVSVLLTNRVCPTRDNIRIRSARPKVEEALRDFAEQLGPARVP